MLLLLAAPAIGGCDRQSQPAQQAEANVSANVAAPEEKGSVDRSHKGEAAPATEFLDPAGKTVTLAAFAGRPVLLNLWATWCAPCVAEMPTLDALAVAQGEKLQVLTISQDFDAEKVAPFFAKAAFKKLQPYLDTETAFSSGMGLNLPTTILYDSKGRELWRVAGEMDWTGAKAAALIGEAR
ncbi:TlpA family protein disulfide reductase [Sphingomonas sp. M1-B02]|uniref:TlpA family protein disulfide reductase n=1 Tax=Sphingomonas sp. M1-B02 TaxID=3114300 RepID=UPI002AD2D6E1|nr:TlpA disulfide reductase family protein [Sphingomonas sp. S6-11]